MDDRGEGGELGAFLKACRARFQPEDVGLISYGGRRRVPGLRREELAQLAGVSPSYYARLEQGTSRHASQQVLQAIAAVLNLSGPEREHLHALATSAGRRRAVRPTRPERPDPALLELLDAMTPVPALILGRRGDILAWNPLGHALLAGNYDRETPLVPGRRVNMTELVFLDLDTRELYVDWDSKARSVVGNLRRGVGAHPDDPALAALIGRLTMASPEFTALWAEHRVQDCATARYELHHPHIGHLTVTQQTLRSPEQPDQTLLAYTAPAGSTSAEALNVLAHMAYPGNAPQQDRVYDGGPSARPPTRDRSASHTGMRQFGVPPASANTSAAS